MLVYSPFENAKIWILQCLNDGTPEVRDAAFSALAGIAKVKLITTTSACVLVNVLLLLRF